MRFLLFVIVFIAANSSFANDYDNLKLIGKTPLKFLGYKIYDIELSGQNSEFSYNQKLAIKITYNKNFTKKELIESSIDEINRINNLEDDELTRLYESRFEELFVDVKKGDEKIAIYDPDFGLEIYHNNKLVGKINDVIFAKRFIDIWLSKEARFRKVRDILIGKK